MFKKYVKLGLLILVTGSAVLGWVLKENNKDQQRAAFYKTKYGSDPEEYLKQYNEWLQLPPEQRANLPWWLDKYGKTKTENQLQKEQQERLNADMEKLATGKKDANPFADILYGQNWRQKLNEYKKQRRMRGYIFTGSIVCTLTGGAIVTYFLVLWIYQILIKSSSNMGKSVPVVSRGQSPNKDEKMTQVVNKEESNPKAKAKAKVMADIEAKARIEAERKSKATGKKSARVKVDTGIKVRTGKKAKADEEKVAKPKEKARAKVQTQEKVRAKVEAKAKVKEEKTDKAETEKVAKAESESKEKEETGEKVGVSAEDGKSMDQHQEGRGLRRRGRKKTKALGNSDWNNCKQDSANQTAVLIPPDEKSIELVESLEKAAENVNVNNKNEDSLKEKTENLEKQMEEFRQMAQGVQQTTIENSQPINNTLSELTQQVSAIREYASSQQDRLSKLQDGYDWNITKTFCMRVIRCIDNLEKRISQLSEKDMEVVDLEEVRDEMLFALESSGVEQYEPELNSDYHGQEKSAEAVKGKESCKNKKQAGKIAKIIRPGYQFFIDEENVKIVRPAQVKLYG
jgi:molecular chaperone GrpE (heat shock protein)